MSIRQLPEVTQDVEAAAAWYDQQRSGLGEDFLDAITEAQAVIDQSPRAFGQARPPIPNREVRRYNVPTFPYAIIYEVNGDDVVIIHVVHARRQPGGWHARLPGDPP